MEGQATLVVGSAGRNWSQCIAAHTPQPPGCLGVFVAVSEKLYDPENSSNAHRHQSVFQFQNFRLVSAVTSAKPPGCCEALVIDRQRHIPRARPRRKRGGRPSNGNPTLSRVKDKSDVRNSIGNWLISSKISSRWKSEARGRSSRTAR